MACAFFVLSRTSRPKNPFLRRQRLALLVKERQPLAGLASPPSGASPLNANQICARAFDRAGDTKMFRPEQSILERDPGESAENRSRSLRNPAHNYRPGKPLS